MKMPLQKSLDNIQLDQLIFCDAYSVKQVMLLDSPGSKPSIRYYDIVQTQLSVSMDLWVNLWSDFIRIIGSDNLSWVSVSFVIPQLKKIIEKSPEITAAILVLYLLLKVAHQPSATLFFSLEKQNNIKVFSFQMVTEHSFERYLAHIVCLSVCCLFVTFIKFIFTGVELSKILGRQKNIWGN